MIDTDEPPRRDTTFEKLSRLAAVYPEGICTAGNSSSENDGAAAVVLMTEKLAGELGLEPLGFLKSFAVAASDPTLTYPAVPKSVDKALAQAGLAIGDMDLIEIQEAFAAQVLADARLMKINEEDLENKVNVNGSGISLGHPIAATGTMRMVTLLHELKRRNARFGLETICAAAAATASPPSWNATSGAGEQLRGSGQRAVASVGSFLLPTPPLLRPEHRRRPGQRGAGTARSVMNAHGSCLRCPAPEAVPARNNVRTSFPRTASPPRGRKEG